MLAEGWCATLPPGQFEQDRRRTRLKPRISILGAGIAGVTCAYEFARRGAAVTIVEKREAPGRGCSWYAGGMLAPWCECETAEPLIGDLGRETLAFWQANFAGTVTKGTIVVAPKRDLPDLQRFSRRTSEYRWLDGREIAAIEPGLAGVHAQALFFPNEAHLDPRAALAALVARLRDEFGVTITRGVEAGPADWTIDCRGLDARDVLRDLRPVKGEMLVLRSPDLDFARPLRMLHPRMPVYIVPRGDGVYMVGATMIENAEQGRVTVRSVLELLSAVYTLHPGFGEAEIIETGSGLRPAFPDNSPRLRVRGRTLYVNGLYRHGFLVAPALARRAADIALDGKTYPELMDEDRGQRQAG
jgi:glycine oxidase